MSRQANISSTSYINSITTGCSGLIASNFITESYKQNKKYYTFAVNFIAAMSAVSYANILILLLKISVQFETHCDYPKDIFFLNS